MTEHFHYLSGRVHTDQEDLRQEAWVKALSRTDHRPNAQTKEELIQRYDHIAGLVVHIYRHEKIKARQRPLEVPLTEDMGIVYNRQDAFEDCTPQERDAINYYLQVTSQDRPLTPYESLKLSRLRKKTGLALRVERYKEK
jgi:hypothetical protein